MGARLQASHAAVVCPVSALKLIISTDSMLFVLLLLVCQHCASFSRFSAQRGTRVWQFGGLGVTKATWNRCKVCPLVVTMRIVASIRFLRFRSL